MEMGNGHKSKSFTGSVGLVREFCKAAWHEVNRFAWTLEQWFDVENNDDVREASISDIAE